MEDIVGLLTAKSEEETPKHVDEWGKTGKPLMIREARWEETQGDSEDNKKAGREGEEREREDVEEIIGSPSARERGGDPVGLVCDSKTTLAVIVGLVCDSTQSGSEVKFSDYKKSLDRPVIIVMKESLLLSMG